MPAGDEQPPNTAPPCGIFDVHPIPDDLRRGHSGGYEARRVFKQFLGLKQFRQSGVITSRPPVGTPIP